MGLAQHELVWCRMRVLTLALGPANLPPLLQAHSCKRWCCLRAWAFKRKAPRMYSGCVSVGPQHVARWALVHTSGRLTATCVLLACTHLIDLHVGWRGDFPMQCIPWQILSLHSTCKWLSTTPSSHLA